MKIIRDASLENDGRSIGIVDVKYPDSSEWDIAGFEKYRDAVLEKVREDGQTYDREVVFRQDPYFRYFRKFKKSYPVMMQLESYILKDRPFPEGSYINAVPFLVELKTHILLGTHDVDQIAGDVVFYNESAKTPFPGMIKADAHSYPNDLTGRDDEGIIISMIAGADNRTCIHDDTSHVLYLIFGLPDMVPYGIEVEGSDCTAQITAVADQIKEAALALAPGAEISFDIY